MNKPLLYAFFLLLIPKTHALEIDARALFLATISKQTYSTYTQQTVIVNNGKELIQAVQQANARNGNTLIQLNKGIYKLQQTLFIEKNNISLVAIDNNPFNTVISGLGMRPTRKVDNLLRVSGTNFILDGVTLKDVGNHLIQIAGESQAHKPIIRNSVLQDGYEQLLKVTYDFNRPNNFSKNGIIENCLFRYTAGIGPQYYIGGIDAHAIQHWSIRNNIFENIASPSKHIAEHAIHIWNNAAHNQVIGNVIINSDRGIGFGMQNSQKNNYLYGNLGGVIKNNIIYHADNNHTYADTGIALEESPETNIINNVIFLEHGYRSGIEYRFPSTSDVFIAQNFTNKSITKRNGASAILLENQSNSKTAKRHLLERLTGYISE